MAVLSFEDSWKAVAAQAAAASSTARPPMSNAQMLSQSFSKTFSTMQEIIHKVLQIANKTSTLAAAMLDICL